MQNSTNYREPQRQGWIDRPISPDTLLHNMIVRRERERERERTNLQNIIQHR